MPGIDGPRVAVLTCAVVEDEVRALLAGLSNIVRVDVLPQGLHNEPARLRDELQQRVVAAEAQADVDAIVLGYGLCSRGVEGVLTTRVPLVIARAHDCITLLLGSRKRYVDYVREHPGTYWYSPGWNRHHVPPGRDRYEALRARYTEQFSADDADYLMEQQQAWFGTYQRATYVDLGIAVTEDDLRFTQECARWLNWQYDRQRGDPGLMRRLLSGPWDDEDFQVLQPGQTLQMTADDRIFQAVPLTVGGTRVVG